MAVRKILYLAILAFALLIAASYSSPVVGGDWTSFIFNNNNTRYQVNSTITSSNAGKLVEAWNITTGTNAVTSTPIVFNGNVYFDDWGGYVYSANVLTGAINWKMNLGGGISSTPLILNNTLYVALGPNDTADTGHNNGILPGTSTAVFALNSSNGKLIWENNLNTTTKMDSIWGSPIVYNGLLYIGVASAGDESHASWKGALYALEINNNGKFAWNTSGAPNTPGYGSVIVAGADGGDGVWATPVISPINNSIYFATGNPYGIVSNSNSIFGNFLFGYAIMSLNATTGKINWYNQVYNAINKVNDTPPYNGLIAGGQWTDDDFGSSANLFNYTSKSTGKTYAAVGVGNKDGNYFIVDRINGTLLQKIQVGTSQDDINPDGGIIGVAAMTNSTNPEIFIPSYYCPGCDTSDPTLSDYSIQGIVTAYYPSNGVTAWAFPTPGAIDGSVAIIPGAIVFGDCPGTGNLYVVNITTGNQIYHQPLANCVDAGITPAEGHLFAPTSFTYYTNASLSFPGLYAYALTKPQITYYNVTFSENGLPIGTLWNASYSTNFSVTQLAPNDIIYSSKVIPTSYSFNIPDAKTTGNVIYIPSPSNGIIVPSNAITISFASTTTSTTTTLTTTIGTSTSTSTTTTSTSSTSTATTTIPANTLNNETFKENELPIGAAWAVTYLNTAQNAITPANITFSSNGPFGIYNFTVSNVSYGGLIYLPSVPQGALWSDNSIDIKFLTGGSVNATNTTSTTTTSTTTTVTTTVSGGGGVVTTGGGGSGGGGSSKPIVTNTSNGYTVNNIAQTNAFNLVFCGALIGTTDNFVTPTSTGVTIDGTSYTLLPDAPVKLNIGSKCYVELLNVSYLPILQTVELEFYNNSTATNTTSPSNSSLNKAVPTNVTSFNVSVSLVSSNSTFYAGNYTNYISIKNVTSITPNAPPGFGKYYAFNITVSNAINATSINVSAELKCNSNGLEPFILGNNDAWNPIYKYGASSAGGNCTIAFAIPADPIVGLMYLSSNVIPLKPGSATVLTTSIVATTTIKQAIPLTVFGVNIILLFVLVVIVIAIIVAIALASSRSAKQKETKETKRKENSSKQRKNEEE